MYVVHSELHTGSWPGWDLGQFYWTGWVLISAWAADETSSYMSMLTVSWPSAGFHSLKGEATHSCATSPQSEGDQGDIPN